MADVFVNYRAVDARFGAASVHDGLARRFGADRVFLDHVSMRPGEVYPKRIREALEQARVLVVLIGPEWLSVEPDTEIRLVDREDDWVRREIRRALERDIVIIPVLLDGTPLPSSDELPRDLQGLVMRQALEVRHRSLEADISKLGDEVARSITDPARRPAYLEQVRHIAPPELYDREEELAELRSFCTDPQAGPYVLWQAPAWAGKSALLSSFVLNPPNGVRLVSFFVTARLAGQSDRAACVDNLIQQLLTTQGEEPPQFLPSSTREAYLLRLLDKAAEDCRKHGEQLVLLVDGLDEDRGAHFGSDAYSIASLLPSRPPAGMRIIVTGRPNPPIPVPEDHPLRNGTVVRPLTPSRHASVIREAMERELKERLYGSPAERDLLALVAVAGGGLTAADLAELTDSHLWEVEALLRTVVGRSFARRVSHYRPGDDPDVYLLGHEELQTMAMTMLGPAQVNEYRQRLHTWAARYRTRRWPANTSEYLLHGYFYLLAETGKVADMVAYATDPDRRDRMRAHSLGDAAALAEITAAQQALLVREPIDLVAMVRLAIHRDDLTKRNNHIPAALPAVCVRLGQPSRAESVADSMTNPTTRVEALASVAKAMTAAGHPDRAASVLGRATLLTHSITNAKNQVRAWLSVADAAAATGEPDLVDGFLCRAEQITHALPDEFGNQAIKMSVADARAWRRPDRVDRTVMDPDKQRLAAFLAHFAEDTACGEPDRAAGWLKRADRIARSMTFPSNRVQAWISIADALADVGDLDSAADFLDRAEQFASSLTNTTSQALALGTLAAAVVATGDLNRAERIARSITSSEHQAQVLTSVADAMVTDGQPDRAAGLLEHAEWIARSITDPDQQAQAWISVADVVATAGEQDRAADCLARAEQIVCSITDPVRRSNALIPVVEAVANAGFLDHAEQLADAVPNPGCRVQALGAVAAAAATAGKPTCAMRILDRAARIGHRITDVTERDWSFESVVEAVATIGEPARAEGLLDRAEQIARDIETNLFQASALGAVAIALAAAGELIHAKRIARSIREPDTRARVLASMAGEVAATGKLDHAEQIARSIADTMPLRQAEAWGAVAAAAEPDRAANLLDRAEQAARNVGTRSWAPQSALQPVAAAAAAAGEPDRAEQIVRSITNFSQQARAWLSVAEAMIKAGALDRAVRIARSVADCKERARVLVSAAAAFAAAGELDRAQQLTHSITDPNEQARAWLLVADVLAVADVPDHLEAPKRLLRRTVAVAKALTLADWHVSVRQLAALAPEVPSTITHELERIAAHQERSHHAPGSYTSRPYRLS